MTQPYLSAAARLLDRELPGNYLLEWTAIVAAKPENIEARTRSAVVFRIGSEWLALPTAAFQEIAELGRVHKLPHSRSSGLLNGLVNVRGELLLCAALDVLLGMEKVSFAPRDAEGAAEARLLVCNHGGERIAFPVNEVVGVHTYLPSDVRNVPATLAKNDTCASQLLYWKDKAIGCLDTERLFQALNKGFQ